MAKSKEELASRAKVKTSGIAVEFKDIPKEEQQKLGKKISRG